MELWDVYDINKNKTSKIIDRHSSQVLSDGQYHLVSEAIIINDKNEILISKRSKNKDKYPLLWECNGGAVKSGENSKQAIIRELNEELGLEIQNTDIIFYKEIRNDNSKNFKDIWIVRKNIDTKDLCFKDREVVDAKWITIDELNDMKNQNMLVPKLEIDKSEFEKILKLIERC